jgi:hypothetical protein
MSYANIAILTADGQTNCNAGQTTETEKWKLENGNPVIPLLVPGPVR